MQRPFVHKTGSGWDGVLREGYVEEQPVRVVRNTIVGWRKASPDDDGPSLELRYFEVPPGAATRLEKHEHEHVVIGGEGIGYAIVGTEGRTIRPHDIVYVAPLAPHQFVNRGDTTFGFYCVVSAHRDRGVPISRDERVALESSDAGAYIDVECAPATEAAPT